MRSTLIPALTGGALIALLASAPCSVAGNSSHPRVKSTAAVASKGTLRFQTWHQYAGPVGQRRWVGERYYGAAYYHPHYRAEYYHPHYRAAYYYPDYGAAYPDYGAAYYQPDSSADSDAVLGTWPVSPPLPAADPPPHRIVQFPVTIFYEYHPHWTVNPF